MARKAIPAEAFAHGDPKRYRRGCHCRPCLDGVTAENRLRRYLRQTGRSTLTTPARAAHHITRLRHAGMPDGDIITAAGVVPDLFYRIMRNAGNIHRATEGRILAVPAPATPSKAGAHTAALGTIRRLRALSADGWSAAELARRLGKHKQFVVHLQNLDTTTEPRVRLWVAAYVRDLYTDIAGQQPEENGVPAHYAVATRKRAAAKGWAPSAYWDDEEFDNHNFQPATSDGGVRQRAAARAEDIGHLARFGIPTHEIASRLGVTEAYVRAQLAGYRAPGQPRTRQEAA